MTQQHWWAYHRLISSTPFYVLAGASIPVIINPTHGLSMFGLYWPCSRAGGNWFGCAHNIDSYQRPRVRWRSQ